MEPVASMRITNSNRREEVPRERSKKMPPRKGRKKRWAMAALKPSACRSGRGGAGRVCVCVEWGGGATMGGCGLRDLPARLLAALSK